MHGASIDYVYLNKEYGKAVLRLVTNDGDELRRRGSNSYPTRSFGLDLDQMGSMKTFLKRKPSRRKRRGPSKNRALETFVLLKERRLTLA